MDEKDLLPMNDIENDNIEKDMADLLHKIGQYENECLQQEIELDDEQCKNLDVKIPNISQLVLECIYDLDLWKPEKKKSRFTKTAAILLIVFAVTSVTLIVDRENVTAFRRIAKGIVSTLTNRSEDIRLQEIPLPSYIPPIPNGFQQTQSQHTDNMTKFQYKNARGEFLTITIYQESYFLSLDNEDADILEDIVIGGCQAKKLVKNEVTLFFIYYQQKVITIASNLPESEITDFADSIKLQK